MADTNYLPRNWHKQLARAAIPTEVLRNVALLSSPDYEGVFTHFIGDALPGEWAAAKTNGTAAAVTVATSKLTLTSGTDNDGYAGQGFGLHWSGDKSFYMACEFTTPASLATVKFEIGVSDATDDAGALGVKATPTGTATDFCVLAFDTDDNTDFDLISSNAGSLSADAEGVKTLVAATSYIAEFRGQNNTVSVFLDGAHVGDSAMEGGSAITPWMFCQTRTTASRVLTSNWMVMVGPAA